MSAADLNASSSCALHPVGRAALAVLLLCASAFGSLACSFSQRGPGGVAAYPDSGGTNDRVTRHFFDWRDRLVASKQGGQWTEASDVHRPIVYCDLDNLGECPLH